MTHETSNPAGIARGLARRPWIVIGIAGALLFAGWVKSTRSEPHHVRVALPSALSLVPGLDVQVDGVDAGKISEIDYRDGKAVVALGIDDAHWPLRQGTVATVRYGTTVGNGSRRVDLEPGPVSAPALPDGGIIPARDAHPPVEIDEVFNTLDARTRRHLQGTVQGSADGLAGHGAAMNRGIRETRPALTGIGALVADLAADTAAMRGLVVNADRTTRVLAARRGAVADLVSVAAATFDEFGNRSAAIRSSLAELPATLSQTRETLHRLDGSVGRLQPLFSDLRPGAASLSTMAPIARAAVARLRDVAPMAGDTLASLRAAAPDVRALLGEAPPLAKELTPTLSQLAPLLACVRPYAPEAAGALSNWASFGQNHDGIAHYARVKVTASPYALNSTPDLTTDGYTKLLPMIKYAMPRPPGLNAGKPWFLPECGAGPESLDPAKDPEDTARPDGPKPTRAATAPAGRSAAEPTFATGVLDDLTSIAKGLRR